MIRIPLGPIFTKKLTRMLRSDRSVAAAKIIGWAIEVASPAYALWMFRMKGEPRFS
jgi:hypothetical protein